MQKTVTISNLLKDVKTVSKQLLHESNIGGVLLSTSFIDSCLFSLLKAYLLQSKVTNKLLTQGGGTLGTYSSKCDIAYCLRLINKETYSDLIKIGEIRNIFAHNHLVTNFSSDHISKCCNSLKAPKYYLDANLEQDNYNDLQLYYSDPKNQFIYTVSSISDLILRHSLSIKARDAQSKNV